MFALQFAKLHGATVIQTSSSDEKLEQAQAMGVDYLINYRKTPDWDKEVMKLTDGRGVDIVVETGGAKTLERSVRSVRFGGFVALIGLIFAGFGQIDPVAVDAALNTLAGYSCRFRGHVSRDESRYCRDRFAPGDCPHVHFRSCRLCLCL